MNEVQMIGYRVPEVKIINNLEDGKAEIKLEFVTKVSVSEANNQFVSSYKVILTGKNGDSTLLIEIEMEGLFEYSSDSNLEKAKAESLNELYPLLRAATVGILAAAAMPALTLPPNHVSPKRVKKPKANE